VASLDVDGRVPAESDTVVDHYVEWDEPETIEAVANALRALGDVVLLEAVDDFPRRLAEARVDFLFNMAEGLRGPNREAHVPAIAEFLGVPYLGSDPLTLGLTLHKGRTKEILRHRGIPTPPSVLIERPEDVVRLRDVSHYPMFLKPVWEGSSKGIAEANHATSPDAAAERALQLLEAYDEPVLAEAYLPGEEFTVAVLGNGPDATCLPLIRYRFEALPDGALPIMGYEAKWLWDVPGAEFDVLECPARIPDALTDEIRRVALAAYQALGCRDWGRVDVRLDTNGAPNVLELNPLPGVIPDPEAHSCFPWAATVAGMTYDELIQAAAAVAWQRLSGQALEPVARTRAAS
jgi:D-alanine-D-alanine ligase